MLKVRDALRRLRAAGWMEVRRSGSHRQLQHPERPGTVTVSGKPGDDLPRGTWRSILRQSGLDEDRR
ncbi:MAG: type II toxin-antitoxin system HicA family toxin [Chloroflexota bacterium]